ncbi:MAG: DUF2203 family protein [Dehalococcoidia bacterium]|nr:DUF2203 family protein [Dehalococcoidia bacterium]
MPISKCARSRRPFRPRLAAPRAMATSSPDPPSAEARPHRAAQPAHPAVRGAVGPLGESNSRTREGLIDSFHDQDGRTVYLRFLLGETAIAHWHDLHTGFAGRQPI